ncbi:MAG TPA: MFS transporter [Chloroflexaceae bacterium]|nr:MFS transporter [Chloroflexaceae bacterium]
MIAQPTAGPAAPAGAAAEYESPQRWWVLAACCVVAFAQLAQPQLWMLGLDIPASAFGTAWVRYRIVANIGVVIFVAFQLMGGVLGDMFGRRRIFLFGAAGAVLANLVSLAAWNLPSLVVARGLVGLLGALAFPLALGVIRLTFGGNERKIALLVYSFVTALGTLASLLGIPLEGWFGWRAALVLPIAVGVVGVVMAWRYVPESRASGGPRRGDAVAAAAWTVVFLALMLGLSGAHTSGGWRNPITLAAGIVGALGLAVMIYWAQAARARRLLRSPDDVPRMRLTLLLLITASLSFALSGYVLQLYQYFFTVQQRSGLVSGLALAPIVLGNIFTLRWAGRFAIEQSRRVVVGGGLSAMAVAMLLTALARPGTPYLLLVPVMTLFGLGFLVASTSWTHFFFSALPGDLSGMSAGINRAAGLVGGALASVLLSTVLQVAGMADFTLRLAELELGEAQQALALEALDEALQLRSVADAYQQSPDELITLGLLSAYRESFSAGVSAALVTAAGVCLAVGALAWLWFTREAEAEGRLRPDARPTGPV